MPGQRGPQLDLHGESSAARWYWRKAPLPDAPLVLIGAGGLHRLGDERLWPASPRLLAALGAQAGSNGAVLAADPSGAVWRLRHAGAAGGQQFWQIQELAESRRRLLADLRRVLASRLYGHVLHELRNPLGALSLHADLLSRLLSEVGPPASADRCRTSVEVIRQRLRELSERQNAAVSLWLEDQTADGPQPVELDRLIDASLRLVRGYMSLQEVRLHAETLQAPSALRLPGHAAALQLTLLAALLAACAGAKQAGTDQVVVASSSAGGSVGLEIRSALDGEALARELAGSAGDSLLAALALVLEPTGITLHPNPEQAVLRLAFP